MEELGEGGSVVARFSVMQSYKCGKGKPWEVGRRGEGEEGGGEKEGGKEGKGGGERRGEMCNLIVNDSSHTPHTSHLIPHTSHPHTSHTSHTSHLTPHTPHTSHTSHPHTPHTSHRRTVWYRTIVIFRPTSQPVESLCTRTRSSCPPHYSLPPATTLTITLHNMQTMTIQTSLRQMS